MTNELSAFEDLSAGAALHLIDVAGQAALRGGQCSACGKRFFPLKQVCPYCGTAAPAVVALPTRGVLYAFTTVHVSSSRPTPYKIGYVDLDGDVRVLSRLQSKGDDLRLGAVMDLSVSAEGEWAFAPEKP